MLTATPASIRSFMGRHSGCGRGRMVVSGFISAVFISPAWYLELEQPIGKSVTRGERVGHSHAVARPQRLPNRGRDQYLLPRRRVVWLPST